MAARPLHLRPSALIPIFVGGLLGTGARYLLEKAYPFEPPGWPWTTFLINLAGAFVLGVILEALVRMGDDSGWRQRARLFAGTGFCGTFTTYSAFALESSLLFRHGNLAAGVGYMVATVVAGGLLAWAGISIAAAVHTGGGRRR
ncbi:CrcB family protein [Nocardia sp. 348MFTsu5.1]|uniref:fluoride efflux transporter FluC n=1 Tax=Nocardia sp. 348MFTsu5.1 TaxID=1172185 RepID=UPI0003708024|nr:CrcB family protein [Nocardia sp. 348MFTsu5.1]